MKSILELLKAEDEAVRALDTANSSFCYWEGRAKFYGEKLSNAIRDSKEADEYRKLISDSKNTAYGQKAVVDKLTKEIKYRRENLRKLLLQEGE